MKLQDLVESYGTVVLKAKRGDFRVDPVATHKTKDHPNSWTKDVANAHVFSEREARKFLRRRAEKETNSNVTTQYDHKNISIVPIEVVNGKPQLIKPKRRLFGFQAA